MSAEERAAKFKALRAAAPSPAMLMLRGAIIRNSGEVEARTDVCLEAPPERQ